MRGSSQAAPMSAPESPTLVKRNAIFADSAATRMSHAAAITAPAPATVPFSAPTIGRRQRRMARMRSQVSRVKSCSTGAGRAFCSGGDVEDIIGALLGRDHAVLHDFTRLTCDLILAMR